MTTMTKILLVDDEREFTDILSQRLTKRNYSVTNAQSGKDALAQLEQDKDMDVVILDVKMPGLDGVEILKMIKKK
jgi:CheY-like chemotaxis protein